MDTATTATVVTAVATVIYTLGTFLLWFSTKRSTDLVAKQLQNQQAQIRSSTFSQIIAGHRELYLAISQEEKLLAAVFGDSNTKNVADYRKQWMGTLLINQCSVMFNEHEIGTLPSSTKDSFVQDAVYMFTFPAVSARWPEVKKFHDPAFVTFIESNVLNKLPLLAKTANAVPMSTLSSRARKR